MVYEKCVVVKQGFSDEFACLNDGVKAISSIDYGLQLIEYPITCIVCFWTKQKVRIIIMKTISHFYQTILETMSFQLFSRPQWQRISYP